jgi:hypothetical protein
VTAPEFEPDEVESLSLLDTYGLLRETAEMLTSLQEHADVLRRTDPPHPDWTLSLFIAADYLGQAWALTQRAVTEVGGLIAVTSDERAAATP